MYDRENTEKRSLAPLALLGPAGRKCRMKNTSTVGEYMKQQAKKGRILTAYQAYYELCAINVPEGDQEGNLPDFKGGKPAGISGRSL